MNEKRMCLCGAVDLSQYDTPGVIVTGWGSHGLQACSSKGTTERLLEVEAAIQRVRDVCDRIWDDARYAHKYGYLEVVREVRYALDGPQ